MLSFFFKLALFLALAGHALALNITFNNVNNITAQDFFAIPPGPYDTGANGASPCKDLCDMSTSMLASCGVTDQQCLCQPTLGMYIQKCEQCLFNFFVATNSIPADPKLGANTALSAYTGACTKEANINMTLALTIAPGWQGHKVEVLNTGVTVVVVGLGGIMGLSLLYIMSNLD